MGKIQNVYQIVPIFLACLAGFTGGMLFSWTSPSIPKIVDSSYYNITLNEASYFSVLPPIASIIACPFVAKLNDIFGRKRTILLLFIPQMTALVLIALASSSYILYISRLVSGIGDACVYTSIPMYIGEITTPEIRGTWGNFLSFSIYFGQFAINVIGSYTSVQECAYICMIFPVIFLITFSLMPESPYFYLMNNKTSKAKTSLQRLRRQNDVEEELIKLKQDVHRQMSESGTWKDLFQISSNRKALFAGIFLRVSQQFSGFSAFAVYTQYIFLETGGDLSAGNSAIVFTGLCFMLNLCAGSVLDKIGRKKSYFASCLLCGVILFVLSLFFYFEKFYPNLDLNFLDWFPLLGMILYMTFFSFGLGIVPTLMLGELFSTSIKAKGLTVLIMVYGLLISGVTKLFHLLDAYYGLFAPFLFFSICCFISCILVLKFVPETRGKTLEQIQQELKMNVVKASD